MDDAFVIKEGDQQCFDLGFLQMTFFGHGKVSEHATDCHFDSGLIPTGLISHDYVFHKQWILVTYGNEAFRSFHPFCFLLVCELVRPNQEKIFRLPKSSRTMVCAVSFQMPNSSTINLSVSHRYCASICHTFSIISGVLFVDGRPERGSTSVISFPSQKRLHHS